MHKFANPTRHLSQWPKKCGRWVGKVGGHILFVASLLEFEEMRAEGGEGRGPHRVSLHERGQQLVHREKRQVPVGAAKCDENQRDPAIQRHGVPSRPI